MPIEIKELHIKATVLDHQGAAGLSPGLSDQEKEKLSRELLQACVQQVVQILEDKKER